MTASASENVLHLVEPPRIALSQLSEGELDEYAQAVWAALVEQMRTSSP
jgi:hypothetical protein